MTYPDVKGHWSEKNINLVSAWGLMEGYPDGLWRPDQFVTRAELAKVTVEQTASTPINRLVSEAMPKTVFISSSFEEGGGVGSGCWIDDWTVLTNAHVVEREPDVPAEYIGVFGYEGYGFSPIDSMPAKTVYVSHLKDLAVLKVEPPHYNLTSHPIVKLSDKEPEIGDWVWALGNPFGRPWDFCDGRIRNVERGINYWQRTQRLYGLSVPINPGNSGGILLNHKGHVIGVPSAGVTGANSFTFAIRLPEVKDVVWGYE